jgi:hypothetical protein
VSPLGATLQVRSQFPRAEVRPLLNSHVVHSEQPKIHRDDQLPGGVVPFSYIKPISPLILQLAKAQISKFHVLPFGSGLVHVQGPSSKTSYFDPRREEA